MLRSEQQEVGNVQSKMRVLLTVDGRDYVSTTRNVERSGTRALRLKVGGRGIGIYLVPL